MPYADILHMSTESDRPKENYKHGTFAVHNVDAVVTQETCQIGAFPAEIRRTISLLSKFNNLFTFSLFDFMAMAMAIAAMV